jgi:hypothetical protein
MLTNAVGYFRLSTPDEFNIVRKVRQENVFVLDIAIQQWLPQ